MKIALIFLLAISISSCSDKQGERSGKHKSENMVNGVSVSATIIKKRKNVVNDDFLYFDFKVVNVAFTPDVKTASYLDFGIQEDFRLINGMDTTKPSIVQRIQNGQNNCYEYVIAFENENSGMQSNISILYSDKIFGIGEQHFEINKKELFSKAL